MKIIETKSFETNRFSYYWSSVILPTLSNGVLKYRKKRRNLIRIIWERKTKKIHLKGKPLIYKVEAAYGCNLKCPLCVERKSLHQKPDQKYMKHADFKILNDKIGDTALRMSFYIFGEPTVNPQLIPILNTAKDSGIFSYFSSNFAMATDEYAENLVKAGLGEISIPLDGWTQDQYERYRVGGKVDRVKEGIISLTNHKRKLRVKRPIIKVCTIRFKHIIDDIPNIKAFCTEHRVDRFVEKPNLEYTHVDSSPIPYAKCFWPWYTMFIDTDGRVYPCVGEQRQRHRDYGNVFVDDFEDIWNSKRMIDIRSFLTAKDKSKFEGKEIPCFNCTRYADCGETTPEVHIGYREGKPVDSDH